MQAATKAERIVKLLRQHSVTAWHRGGRVFAIGHYTMMANDGDYEAHCDVFELFDMPHAMRWLGY